MALIDSEKLKASLNKKIEFYQSMDDPDYFRPYTQTIKDILIEIYELEPKQELLKCDHLFFINSHLESECEKCGVKA